MSEAPELDEAFDALLRAPLGSRRALRKELEARIEATEGGGRALPLCLALCTGLRAKTSPLYARLVQAACRWVLDHPEDPRGEALALHVAARVKRFDLIG